MDEAGPAIGRGDSARGRKGARRGGRRSAPRPRLRGSSTRRWPAWAVDVLVDVAGRRYSLPSQRPRDWTPDDEEPSSFFVMKAASPHMIDRAGGRSPDHVGGRLLVVALPRRYGAAKAGLISRVRRTPTRSAGSIRVTASRRATEAASVDKRTSRSARVGQLAGAAATDDIAHGCCPASSLSAGTGQTLVVTAGRHPVALGSTRVPTASRPAGGERR